MNLKTNTGNHNIGGKEEISSENLNNRLSPVVVAGTLCDSLFRMQNRVPNSKHFTKIIIKNHLLFQLSKHQFYAKIFIK